MEGNSPHPAVFLGCSGRSPEKDIPSKLEHPGCELLSADSSTVCDHREELPERDDSFSASSTLGTFCMPCALWQVASR